MLRRPSLPRVALLLALAAATACSEDIPPGRWSGTADLGAGEEPMSLRLLADGALADFPGRGLFGLPIASFLREEERVTFSLPGESGELVFVASRLSPGRAGAEAIGGVCAGGGGFEGAFRLELEPDRSAEERYAIDTGRGLLPGSLLLPPEDGNGLAVVLLVAGAGPIDRDGNNYAVPGRCDSLKALAEALAARGVASLRYDKRGAGEAYVLVRREEDLVFSDHVDDAIDALRALASDGRFARIVVAGEGEGALVAAAALAGFRAAGLADDRGRRGRYALALLCAPAASPLETVEEALAGLPPERAEEGSRIVSALREGSEYPLPGPFFADFFRPSIQPYLISSFRYSLAEELAKTSDPLLVAVGARDSSVGEADVARILAARPRARVLRIEGMGRALKELGEDPEDEYRAYVDPSMPLSTALADSLAAFASEGLGRRRPTRRGDAD